MFNQWFATCFFCRHTKNIEVEELKSIIVYSCETARKHHYHESCLRAALLSEDDEKVFLAMRIVKGIQRRNEEKQIRTMQIASALEYLDGA